GDESGNLYSGLDRPAWSPNGRFIAFNSEATDLVPGYVRGVKSGHDLFLRDLATGTTVLVSYSDSGTSGGNRATSSASFAGNSIAAQIRVSDSGQVVFTSNAGDLVAGKTIPGLFNDYNADSYAFDDTGAGSIAGNLFDDLNGNGVHDVAAGAGWSMNFSGKDSVKVPDSPELDGTGAATLSTWVRFDKLPSAAGMMVIAAKSRASYDLSLQAEPDNKFYFYAANGSRAASTSVIETGTWYHVAGTYAAEGQLQMIVNGVVEGTKAIPKITRKANGNMLAIGGDSLDQNAWLQGTVDEVQFWNVARTAAEIQADMGHTLTGSEPGLAGYWNFNDGAARDMTGLGHDGVVGAGSVVNRPVRTVSTAPITPADPPTDQELGLACWTVFLDANANGRFDPDETSVITDTDGNYRFTGLAAGTYRVGFVPLDGYIRTTPVATPGTRTVTLATGTTAIRNIDFGAQLALADLDVAGVLAPAASEPGRQVQVSWIVRNAGSTAITASWQDAVYLSSDPILDDSDRLITTVPQTGGLASHAQYTGTAAVKLPAVLPGKYYLIVDVDRRYQVPNETNRANNILATTEPVSLSVPSLTLGTPFADEFGGAGEAHYYRVTPGGAQTLTVALDSAASGGATALYVSQFHLPTRGDFDFAAETAGADQNITIPTTGAGAYYILAEGIRGEAASDGFTLTATIPTLAIESIDLSSGGNTGQVTIGIRGTLFTAATQVQLLSGPTVINAASVDFRSPSLVYATFDLTGQPTGTYDVKATVGASSVTLTEAFTVTPGQSNPVEVFLSTPAGIRNGRWSSVLVEYTNTGNTDVVAPLLQLNATNCIMRLADDQLPTGDYVNASLWFLGIAPDGPAGILRPGQSGSVRVYFRTIGGEGAIQVDFQLNVLAAPDSAFDWAALKTSLRPSYVAADAWDAVYPNLTANLGDTAASYNAALAADATYLSQLGERTSNVSRLFGFEIEKANAAYTATTLATNTDDQLPTPGLALTFQRHFLQPISGRYRLGPLGRGWAHNWEISLASDAQGNVTLDSAGSLRYFAKQADGTYLSPPGDHRVLTALAGGGYELGELDGAFLAFHPDGTLNYQQDANGNRITAGYTAGRLTSLTHSNGAAFTLDYDTDGRLISLQDSSGRTITYGYGADGEHLTTYRDVFGTTQYTYATGQGTASEHALASVAFSDNTHEFFAYDSQGRLVDRQRDNNQESLSYTYDTVGGFTVTDANGASTTVHTDDLGRVCRTADPIGRIVERLYDKSGNLTDVIGPLGSQYSYTYDSLGDVTSVTDPLGLTVYYTYDAHGRLLSFQDPRGNANGYRYDSTGNLLSITYPNNSLEQFSYDPLGNPTEWVNRRGHAIGYEYNGAGQVTKKSFADGTSRIYTYDARGNLLTAADAAGTIILEHSDPSNPDLVTKITYADGRFLRFEYNLGGKRSKSVDQSGFAINYLYDALGRLQKLTEGSDMLIVEYTYNAAGQLIRKDLGNGTRTTYEYDQAGQLLHLVNLAPGHTTINSRFDYEYDALGRRTSMTTDGVRTDYTYDAAGQLIGIAMPGRTIQYVYDAAGNRVSVSDNGVTTPYNANNLNQYVSVGGVTYTYDADGNLLSKTDSTGTTIYTFNDENRLTGISGPGATATYQYNSLGQLTSSIVNGQAVNNLVDPFGLAEITAQYDDSGALLGHYTWGFGLVSQVGSSGAAGYYDFDALGSTVGISDGGGAYVNRYRYLPFGETTTVQSTLSNPFTFIGCFGVSTDSTGFNQMGFRTYDPTVGQFTSQDPIGLAGGDTNLRRYVRNAPMQFIDPAGLQSLHIPLHSDLARRGDVYFPIPMCRDPVAVDAVKRGAGELLRESWPDAEDDLPLPDPEDDFPFPDPEDIDPGDFIDWPPSPATKPAGNGSSKPVGANDPNDIVGPGGFGTEHFIAGGHAMPYTIDFENVSTATAPAQEIFLTQQLGPNLDWSTFALDAFSFGSIRMDIPAGLKSYQTSISTKNSDDTPLRVNFRAELDQATGLVTWTFRSVDPATGELPEDAFAGLLPPNDSSGRGQGYVTYTVQPKADLASGTTIDASASIVFDFNKPVVTNTFTNTIDAGPPQSSVAALPALQSSTTFLVSWAGSDDAPAGSGIATYQVFVSDNGGPFNLWQPPTTETSTQFTGEKGHFYAFYSVAVDNVGYIEATPAIPDTQTAIVDDLGPVDSLSKTVSVGLASWYRLETTHTGLLTVDSVPSSPAAILVELYATDHTTLLASSQPWEGKERINLPVESGTVYYFKLQGNDPSADLQIANLVQQTGSSVTVYGTPGADQFTFDATAGSRITINGVDYAFTAAEASRFSFDGLDGNDDVRVVGSSGADDATIDPTEGAFSGTGYALSVRHIESSDYDGGEGEDTVWVWGSKAGNTYTARPGSAEMTGGGVSITAKADRIYGRGGGGADTATIWDSPGDDLFEFFPIWARTTGEGYFHNVQGFTTMIGKAERGVNGTDEVFFRGSPHGDWLKSTTVTARMLTLGAWRHAEGFDTITAYSRGGKDKPDLLLVQDTSGADTLKLKPLETTLTTPEYSVTAYGFGSVEATRVNVNAAEDNVTLEGSPGDDTFVGNPAWSRISSSNPVYSNKAAGFSSVMAYSTGEDTFTAGSTVGELTGPGYRLWARFFDEVHAEVKLGRDIANLSGTTGIEELHGTAAEVSLSGLNAKGAFANFAKGFDEINAFAGGGQDKAILTDAAVDLTTYGPPSDVPLEELAQILWLNQFEKIELHKSGTGEKTDIDNIDAVFAWWE
ncbi:MAG: hypothetical protein HUU20_25520, partial [Pirellulales bacterium]|nr:hypothetical protein [Pirellulales bacterium]